MEFFLYIARFSPISDCCPQHVPKSPILRVSEKLYFSALFLCCCKIKRAFNAVWRSAFKTYKNKKSSRFRLLSAPMWHRTRAWLFLYIYFIFISLSSDNTTVFPSYPVLSRSFPYTPPCDIECAPPQKEKPERLLRPFGFDKLMKDYMPPRV